MDAATHLRMQGSTAFTSQRRPKSKPHQQAEMSSDNNDNEATNAESIDDIVSDIPPQYSYLVFEPLKAADLHNRILDKISSLFPDVYDSVPLSASPNIDVNRSYSPALLRFLNNIKSLQPRPGLPQDFSGWGLPIAPGLYQPAADLLVDCWWWW